MIKQLKYSPSFEISQELSDQINSKDFVFNPSLIFHRNLQYIAFRVYDDRSESILALLYILKDDKVVKCMNLSEWFLEKEQITKVADPKMFVLNNEVHCTFNTGDGNKIHGPNKIYLVRFEGESIADYYNCEYTKRQITEKNWAFYFKDSTLFALYSLEPLTILKASEKKGNTIHFETHVLDKSQNFNNHSIGTQLSETDGKHVFIAHKKYYRKRKRLYIGKPCELDLTDKPKVKIHSVNLIHSIKSLLGDKHKFNKNLISCSYFSGIQKYGHTFVLSYGINDVCWNIAIVKTKLLWP